MKTLQEIANALGVSKTRISQIEKKALVKIRIALEARGVNVDDLALLEKVNNKNR